MLWGRIVVWLVWALDSDVALWHVVAVECVCVNAAAFVKAVVNVLNTHRV